VTGALRARVAALAKLIELLVFPSACRLCAAILDETGERIVCRDCLGRLVPRQGPVCPVCGRFLESAGEEHPCGRCLGARPAFSFHRSCGAYAGTLKDVVLLFKYRKCAPLSRPLARFAETALASSAPSGQTCAVPLHRARRRDRGFNQSRLLARDLAKGRGMKVLGGVLVKARNVPPQAGLRAAERERNVVGAYAVRRPDRIRGRTLILVDDVTTTGATLRECARVLIRAGAKEVRAITHQA
jgi:ComF family protein